MSDIEERVTDVLTAADGSPGPQRRAVVRAILVAADPPPPDVAELRAELARVRLLAHAALDGWAAASTAQPSSAKYPDGFRSPLDKSPDAPANVAQPGEDVTLWHCPPMPDIAGRRAALETADPKAAGELRRLVYTYGNARESLGTMAEQDVSPRRIDAQEERCDAAAVRLLDALGAPRDRPLPAETTPPAGAGTP